MPSSKRTTNDLTEAIRKYLLIAIAIACAGMGILRARGAESIDLDVLWFFAAAGVLLTLDKIREFAIGKDGISAKLADVEQRLDEVESIAIDNAQVTGSEVDPSILGISSESWDVAGSRLPRITVFDDPQKGRLELDLSQDVRFPKKFRES